MRGVIREAAVELAALGDVMEHEHAAGHRARAIADRRRGALDVQLVAVATDQQHRAHALDRARAADRHAQRILERLAGLFVERAVDLFDGPAHRVFEAPAGELLGHGIDVVHRGVRIGRDHAVTDGLQRDLRALLLAEQRFFVELAFGDVELDTDQAQQAPMFIHARLGAAHHPAPVAVAVLHAMHGFENRRLAGDVIADRALHARHVFGMHQAAPVGRIELRVDRIAQHLLPARREMDFVALDVEVPEAVVGRALGELEAFFELVQALFDAQASRGRRPANCRAASATTAGSRPRRRAAAHWRARGCRRAHRTRGRKSCSTEPMDNSARRLALDQPGPCAARRCRGSRRGAGVRDGP